MNTWFEVTFPLAFMSMTIGVIFGLIQLFLLIKLGSERKLIYVYRMAMLMSRFGFVVGLSLVASWLTTGIVPAIGVAVLGVFLITFLIRREYEYRLKYGHLMTEWRVYTER